MEKILPIFAFRFIIEMYDVFDCGRHMFIWLHDILHKNELTLNGFNVHYSAIEEWS